jgi:hypothetical protein
MAWKSGPTTLAATFNSREFSGMTGSLKVNVIS